MNIYNNLEDERWDLQERLELLETDLYNEKEEYAWQKDAYEDWGIPHSCGGGGDTKLSNDALGRMHKAGDRIEKLNKEIGTICARLNVIDEKIEAATSHCRSH